MVGRHTFPFGARQFFRCTRLVSGSVLLFRLILIIIVMTRVCDSWELLLWFVLMIDINESHWFQLWYTHYHWHDLFEQWLVIDMTFSFYCHASWRVLISCLFCDDFFLLSSSSLVVFILTVMTCSYYHRFKLSISGSVPKMSPQTNLCMISWWLKA